MTRVCLDIQNLTARWPQTGDGVEDVSLQMTPGQRVAVLGANGSGKSTLLLAVMGLLPAAGRIVFNGTDITHLAVARRARLGIGLVPQGRRLFPGLSVEETLIAAGPASRRLRRQRRDRVLTLFPGLGRRLRTTAWRLSGGEQHMLAIARALMMQPALLLLDEPSAGLAPAAAAGLYDRLADLADDGMAMLVAEQNITAALAFAPRTLVMSAGRVVADEASRRLEHGGRLADLLLHGKRGQLP
ncbi:MAG: ATP-binding cassette domain-containing protein, partial [Alphaproteobacteria bacterium]